MKPPPRRAGRDPASVSKGQENRRVEDEARTRTEVVKYCQKWATEHGYRKTVKRSRPIKRGKRFESNRGSVEMICSLGEEPRRTGGQNIGVKSAIVPSPSGQFCTMICGR